MMFLCLHQVLFGLLRFIVLCIIIIISFEYSLVVIDLRRSSSWACVYVFVMFAVIGVFDVYTLLRFLPDFCH